MKIFIIYLTKINVGQTWGWLSLLPHTTRSTIKTAPKLFTFVIINVLCSLEQDLISTGLQPNLV